MNVRTAALALSVAALLSGCATAALSPAGSKVVASPNVPVEGCQYLGNVIGQGGGAFGGGYVSNDKLMEYALNDAQNKAAAKGATHLQTTPPQLGGSGGTTTTATVTGTAYKCAVAEKNAPGTPVAPAAAPATEAAPAAATAADTTP